jgi:hypothetical protein
MRYIDPEDQSNEYTKRLNETMMDKEEKQMWDDLDAMSDEEFVAKYPEMCEEWLTEEQIKEVKPVYMYFLEQGILYIEEGGYIPKRLGGGQVQSDLRINHPANTVRSAVITLREDYIGNSDNNPKNDPDDGDPRIWVFDADDSDWNEINLRRIHHVFSMNLKKWYPNQHWLLYKFSKYQAEVDYFVDWEHTPEKFPSKESIKLENYKMKQKVNLTLKPDLIPEEPEQDRMPDEPENAKHHPESVVRLWNLDDKEWVDIKIGQFYHIKWEAAESELPDPKDDPEYDPKKHEPKPERGRPSNWEELRDGLEKEPRWDD